MLCDGLVDLRCLFGNGDGVLEQCELGARLFYDCSPRAVGGSRPRIVATGCHHRNDRFALYALSELRSSCACARRAGRTDALIPQTARASASTTNVSAEPRRAGLQLFRVAQPEAIMCALLSFLFFVSPVGNPQARDPTSQRDPRGKATLTPAANFASRVLRSYQVGSSAVKSPSARRMGVGVVGAMAQVVRRVWSLGPAGRSAAESEPEMKESRLAAVASADVSIRRLSETAGQAGVWCSGRACNANEQSAEAMQSGCDSSILGRRAVLDRARAKRAFGSEGLVSWRSQS